MDTGGKEKTIEQTCVFPSDIVNFGFLSRVATSQHDLGSDIKIQSPKWQVNIYRTHDGGFVYSRHVNDA